MKQVIAVIRRTMMNATREALVEAGFSAFTVRNVLGRGQGNVDYQVISGAEAGAPEAIARLKDDGPMLIAKRMMTIVVPDEAVSKLIDTIIRVNKTGNRGDGKIFVLPIGGAFRIRTGERDAEAVNIN
jgi:nitrogen regulatory protein PII 2